ncbi:MAG: hypothetical protein WCK67_04375 [bacterium]
MPNSKVNKVSSQLAGIFACFTMLVTGTNILFRAQSLDFDSVIYMLKISIPASFVAWCLGYATGKVFEGASFSFGNDSLNSKKNKDLGIDDILFDDIKETEPTDINSEEL